MKAGAATHAGLVRGRNEDRFWMDNGNGVFLVVDGVGGHAGGELAAETAVTEIRDELLNGIQSVTVEQRIRLAITRANNRIFDLAQADASLAGMACVLTLAQIEDDEVTIGHVGDSRLYLVWEGALSNLTSDHSPVGEAEESRALTEQEAMAHPRRNEVFRDVGSRPRIAGETDFIEIRKCKLRPDAALLLCTDGLTDQLTTTEVRDILAAYDGDAERVANELVEAANAAGGKDNATVLFIAGPHYGGGNHVTRPRLNAAPIAAPLRLLTGRAAFLAYGLLIGMLMWVLLRAVKG